MSQMRFRQVARLEELAQPYLKRKQQIEREWRHTVDGAADHAAILAFLVRYGDPQIDEPLSCAWERFTNTHVWKEYVDSWEAMERGHLNDESRSSLLSCFEFSLPCGRDGALIIGSFVRHALIDHFAGPTEKEKLARIFATAPPWLIWFTFADFTAELLGLPLPDLSSVAGFARSRTDFDNWPGLPGGAFVPRRWPDGPDNEPLARTDLNLLRPSIERPISPITHREYRRVRASHMKVRSAKSAEKWPELVSLEFLTMPF